MDQIISLLGWPTWLPWRIDWGAWATFAVGIVAVVGAVKVGRRQGDIADRQNRILENQIEVEAAKLRADLYDRRAEMLRQVIEHMANVMSEKHNPEAAQAFYSVLSSSPFIFGKDVEDVVKDIHDSTISLQFAKLRLGQAKTEQEAEIAKDAVSKAFKKTNDAIPALIRAMEPYLGIHQGTHNQKSEK